MPKRIESHKPTSAIVETSLERQQDIAFYTQPRWRRLAKWKKQLSPLCERCSAYQDLQVHHRIDRKKRPDLAYELSNLETLCRSCHSKETAKRQQKPE